MAGRGIQIELRVNGFLPSSSEHPSATSGSGIDNSYGFYKFDLQIAGHSPVHVLKMEIFNLVGIPPDLQVMQLKDITDKDGNRDYLLSNNDERLTVDALLRYGSKISSGNHINAPILSVHSLAPFAIKASKGVFTRLSESSASAIEANSCISSGSSGSSSSSSNSSSSGVDAFSAAGTQYFSQSESKNKSRQSRLKEPAILSLPPTSGEAVLTTSLTPAQADHSFNGIIFDVMSIGNYDIEVKSVSIGGMLGRMRIYVLDSSWQLSESENQQAHHWSHHNSIDRDRWRLVADRHYPPSWDHETEIVFDTPLLLHPRHIASIFCHSSLPDDLGIQYRSASSSEGAIANDKKLAIFPGIGFTGSVPFDDTSGWYRGNRAPCGSIRYRYNMKNWTPAVMRSLPFFSHSHGKEIPVNEDGDDFEGGQESYDEYDDEYNDDEDDDDDDEEEDNDDDGDDNIENDDEYEKYDGVGNSDSGIGNNPNINSGSICGNGGYDDATLTASTPSSYNIDIDIEDRDRKYGFKKEVNLPVVVQVRPPNTLKRCIYSVLLCQHRQLQMFGASYNKMSKVGGSASGGEVRGGGGYSFDSNDRSTVSFGGNGNKCKSMLKPLTGDSYHPIGRLPTHLILYLLEFVGWDWFDNLYHEKYTDICKHPVNLYQLWQDSQRNKQSCKPATGINCPMKSSDFMPVDPIVYSATAVQSDNCGSGGVSRKERRSSSSNASRSSASATSSKVNVDKYLPRVKSGEYSDENEGLTAQVHSTFTASNRSSLFRAYLQSLGISMPQFQAMQGVVDPLLVGGGGAGIGNTSYLDNSGAAAADDDDESQDEDSVWGDEEEGDNDDDDNSEYVDMQQGGDDENAVNDKNDDYDDDDNDEYIDVGARCPDEEDF